jgi:1-deoxy-D-xylulose-5-phosphate reductoisomerase
MNDKKRTISILGATGSIGIQALEVIDSLDIDFNIGYLTVNHKIKELGKIVKKYTPKGVVINSPEKCELFKKEYNYSGKILCGQDGLIEAASDPDNDIVLSALVGFSGVIPTLAAIENGITVALANKETLVSAGSVITKAAKSRGVDIIAVDSEHSAILQCMVGEDIGQVEKLVLTASGGPFRNTPADKFAKLTVKEALDHPNWSMGSKITIDSATMMNKGFEVIEAYWLFGLNEDQIDILVHPQSIVHSMVEFIDGSVKAQLGLPDMRLPIAYALTWPDRATLDFPKMDLSQLSSLEFYRPDMEKFPCLRLAFESLKKGGTAPAIINSANEIAVEAFLRERIKFIDIPKSIEFALNNSEIIKEPSLENIISADAHTRKITNEFIESLNN